MNLGTRRRSHPALLAADRDRCAFAPHTFSAATSTEARSVPVVGGRIVADTFSSDGTHARPLPVATLLLRAHAHLRFGRRLILSMPPPGAWLCRPPGGTRTIALVNLWFWKASRRRPERRCRHQGLHGVVCLMIGQDLRPPLDDAAAALQLYSALNVIVRVRRAGRAREAPYRRKTGIPQERIASTMKQSVTWWTPDIVRATSARRDRSPLHRRGLSNANLEQSADQHTPVAGRRKSTFLRRERDGEGRCQPEACVTTCRRACRDTHALGFPRLNHKRDRKRRLHRVGVHVATSVGGSDGQGARKDHRAGDGHLAKP